ncbi:hydrogenase maturation factor HoxX-like isoform X2 [Hydra vulgaris]|uniref:Hydrogenase maturation factor HoxX-like isoform X2 n=1 Tax=Hydra vulgaris TaxID=6087 RepID=A0ABM4B2Z6_HYDVU
MSSKSLDILLFLNKFNGLSQRIFLELQKLGHQIKVLEINKEDDMLKFSKEYYHDLIICPFLTKRVPREIWSNETKPCLIVHPGIQGDRGLTSLDWAIKENKMEWGVTVLQAAENMDAGNIWSTTNFSINRSNMNLLTKSSLYSNEVTNASVVSVLQAVKNFIDQVPSKPLDYSDPNTKGVLKRNMNNQDREIDWKCSAEEISSIIRMSDTQPGAIAVLSVPKCNYSNKYRIFGSVVEKEQSFSFDTNAPGDVVGHRNGAILVKCKKSFIWLSHLKSNKLKLPALYWLNQAKHSTAYIPAPKLNYLVGEEPQTFQEIWINVVDGVCFIHFNFYNGAMSVFQCKQLKNVLKLVDSNHLVKTVVLMGGYNCFSNGIHLNVIDNAEDSFDESWENINAINDVVKQIFQMSKITISALQGNAGAGGCMMALASDYVWCRKGVVLNPHYKSMKLFGSEYHTYFLKKRVGINKSRELLDSAMPILSSTALDIGMFDKVEGNTVEEFRQFVYKESLSVNSKSYIKNNSQKIYEELEHHRNIELSMMNLNFRNADYNEARRNFVHH